MRILFVVPYAPTRIRTRPFHLIRALSDRGHAVTVATLWSNDHEQAALDELARRESVQVIAAPLGRADTIWNCIRAAVGPDPLQAHYSWSPRLARQLHEAVTERTFDVVHVEHLRGVRYGLMLAREQALRPAVVWDAVDCISTLFRHASRESVSLRTRVAARFESRRTERYEADVVARFDRVLVTSVGDQRDLAALSRRTATDRQARIEVLPNGVDLRYFSPAFQPREPATIVITGKMSYHANATAVVWFVNRVLPVIWSHRPDVRLVVVGQAPPPEVMRLADGRRIDITGRVDDLRPYLRSAAVSVAPIQYGVGIQNKVLEAMACGTPVVASPAAVAGLDARDGLHLIVASDPNEWARVITTLLGDAQRRAALGASGRAFVEQRHDWSSIGCRLETVYHGAVAAVA